MSCIHVQDDSLNMLQAWSDFLSKTNSSNNEEQTNINTNTNTEPSPSLSVSSLASSTTTTNTEEEKKFQDLHAHNHKITMIITPGQNPLKPAGPGYGRNRAVRASHGSLLCFLDADDIMFPTRVACQYEAAQTLSENTLIGTNFVRLPRDATPRYTDWLNALTPSQLYTQRFKEVTLLQPTWFMRRSWFDAMGQQNEVGLGL